MANYSLDNFLGSPTSEDKVLRIYDKNGILQYTLNVNVCYFFYKNEYIYIHVDNSENLTLDFPTNDDAILALEKLNTAKKYISQIASDNVDYFTKDELLVTGILDYRYYTNSAITSILGDYSVINHNHKLSGLTDVTINSIINGEVLVYENGVWVNSSFTFDASSFLNNYYSIGQLSSNTSGVYINWNNLIDSPTSITNYGISDVYTMGEVYTKTELNNGQLNNLYYPQTVLFTKPEIVSMLSYYSLTSHTHNQYSLTSHTHDDRYYTINNIDILLSGKSNINHTHPQFYTSSQTDILFENYYTSSQTNAQIVYLNSTLVTTVLDGKYISISGSTGITGDLTPLYGGLYSLGSINKQWKKLYVSGGSIFLDNYELSVNSGNLVFDGNTILTSLSLSNYYTISQTNNLLLGKSDTGHTHNQYSLSSHTHNQYSLSSHTHNLSDLTNTSHTHDERYYLTSLTYTQNQVNNLLNNYSLSSHTHNQYSLSSHTHNQYSLTSHTHNLSDLTNSSHTHDERYYTETEIDNNFYTKSVVYTKIEIDGKFLPYYNSAQTNLLLLGKSDSGHTHNQYSLTSHTHNFSDLSNTSHTHDDRYYTETEIDNTFYTKSVVYTKPEIDGKFLPYYNSSQTLGLFTNYYTKSEVDNKLNNYYTSSQTNTLVNNYYASGLTLLAGKSDTGHTHNQYSLTSHTHDFYTTGQIDIKLSGYSTIGSLTSHTSLTGVSNPHLTSFYDLINTAHTHDDIYYTKTQLNNGQLNGLYYTKTISDGIFATYTYVDSLFSSTTSIYYSKTQVDNLLLSKSNTSHTHKLGDLSGVSLTTLSNGDILVYSGGSWINSTMANININLSQYYTSAQTNILLLGKSDTGHTHNFSDLMNTAHTHSQYSLTSHTHNLGDLTNTSHTHDDRYYTETEIDNTFYTKSVVYTKSEVDSKLIPYYNSSQTLGLFTNYYTSSQTNVLLGGYSVTGHNHRISGLTDVLINSISDGQVLVYSGGTWVNSGISMDLTNYYNKTQVDNLLSSITFNTGATVLDQLNDVSLNSVVVGQALVYNGSLWVNSSITANLSGYYTSSQTNLYFLSANTTKFSSSAHTHYLSGLTDVVSGATDGQFLQYSSGTWRPVTSPSLVGNFVSKSGDIMTGELGFNYMSGITDRILYVNSAGTVKEGDDIISMYITDSSIINIISGETGWSGRTFTDPSLSSYTLYEGQRYVDSNYFYEYFGGKLYRTFYSLGEHNHNTLYYTKTELSPTGTTVGVLDYRYLKTSALSSFTLLSLSDVNINLDTLASGHFLRYSGLSGWTNYYINFDAIAYKNEVVLTGRTVIGVSGLSGGGSLNNDLQITHLTAQTKTNIISSTSTNPLVMIQSINWDQYGHINSYQTADYSSYWVRYIDDAHDVLIQNRNVNDYLYWNGSKWTNSALTMNRVNGLLPELTKYVKLSASTQTIYGDILLHDNMVITGNLDINGSQTNINTNSVNVGINEIKINTNVSDPNPYDKSGIRINRGNKPDYYIVFDEGSSVENSGGCVKIGVDSDLKRVLTEDDLGSVSSYWMTGTTGVMSLKTISSGNDALGDYSMAVGYSNTTISNYSFVGGYSNTNYSNSDYSFVGGFSNTNSGISAFIYSTNSHNIGEYNTIIGGYSNNICNKVSNQAYYSAIIGGNTNTISGHTAAAILGGSNNTIDYDISSLYETILGGQYNTIYGAESGFIAGGEYNTLYNQSYYSGILGGLYNNIGNSGSQESTSNMIVGGVYNNIINGVNNSAIIGGSGITAVSSNTVYVPNLSIINKLCINTTGTSSQMQILGIYEYSGNSAAISAGLLVGAVYHTAGILKIVYDEPPS